MKRKRDKDEVQADSGEGSSSRPSGPSSREQGNLARQLSMVPIKLHEGLPAVQIYPRVVLKQNGTIKGLDISSLTRTPSPFKDGRMGDHTVAWQAIVDSVRALVHGLSPAAALTALWTRQLEVQVWMSVPESPGRKLLAQLDDRVERKNLLSDAAARVAEQHSQAGQIAGFAGVGGHLELAIAWHLTYLNYLPFATVPAAARRGSRGATEGNHRKTILAQETKGMVGPDQPVDDPDGSLSAALWGLFSFDAALRETNAAAVIVPSIGHKTTKTCGTLDVLAAQCIAEADWILTGPMNKRGNAVRISPQNANRTRKTKVGPELTRIFDAASGYSGEKLEYSEITKLAGAIRDAANYMRRDPLQVPTPGAGIHRTANEHKIRVSEARGDVAVMNGQLIAARATAMHDTALALACMLYDHQVTVARAYPRAVIVSGFLAPTPLKAAVAELEAQLTDLIDTVRAADKARSAAGKSAEKADSSDGQGEAAEGSSSTAIATSAEESGQLVQALLGEFEQIYLQLGGAPAPANGNGWVESAATSPFVVSLRPNGSLKIQGRPRAPAGVGGMGSHTTAWVVEVMAAEAIVGMKAGQEALDALQKQVGDELVGPVMALDQLLPAAQLSRGQLNALFGAACEVYQATAVEDAVASYLTFRNLLPYATVDAGKRGSRGERREAAQKKLFDAASLRQAADLQSTRLTEELDERGRREGDPKRQKGDLEQQKDKEPEDADEASADAEGFGDIVGADLTADASIDAGTEPDEYEASQQDEQPRAETGREIAMRVLIAAADGLTEENARWGLVTEVMNAVSASVNRLKEWARSLDADIPDRADIYNTIVKVRKVEHTKVYKLSRRALTLADLSSMETD